MSVTREQVVAALLTVIAKSGDFVVTGRRNRAPESVTSAQSPAVFLVKSGESYQRAAPNLPPVRVLRQVALFYNDVGPSPNAIPDTVINNALDALDTLILPDDPRTGYFTLGGLVISCMISGEVRCSSGESTGKFLAVVPFEIILP